MTPELTVLTLSTLWLAVHFAVYSVAANRQVGVKTALGPRDEPIRLTGFAGRAQRAMNNMFEAMILFTPAIAVIELSDQNSAHTMIAAWAFYAARVLYMPAYLFGWVPARSLIWMVGFFATLILLAAALIP
jgi:uncharacterized MAPEG superfamily protein